MTVAGVVAAAAIATQLAGGAPDAVAAAYARAAESMPLDAILAHPRGRRDVLAWQISFADLSLTQRAVYNAILLHYNHERMDAWPSYETIAERAGCDRRTAIRVVKELERLGFVTIERRFRVGDRWPGRDRRQRTNVYRFVDGRTPGGSAEPSPEPLESTPPRPSDPAPVPSPISAPAPDQPLSTSSSRRGTPAAARDPYWETFSSAFGAEHRRVYGTTSNPGFVTSNALLGQAGGLLVEIVSECGAWAQQRGLDVDRNEIARDLSRRMASRWISWSGLGDRLRDRGHPIGWICGDLPWLAHGRNGELGAVESWKRAQEPKAPRLAIEEDVAPIAPADTARVRAEARALNALLSRGLSFEHAVRLVRAESERLRAPPTGAGPPLA